jgi:hypothetical protein
VNELDDLRQQVAELRTQLEALQSTTNSRVQSPERAPHTRREVLRRIGVGAGVAVSGFVALPRTVSAAPANSNTDPITAGEENVCTQTTELRYPGNLGASPRSHVLAVQDGAWNTPRVPNADNTPETGTRGAVGAYAGNDAMHGGFFQTNSSTLGGAGIRALGENGKSYGVWAAGRRAALRLERVSPQIPPPTRADPHNEGEFVVDDNSDLWYCVTPGSPGTWLKLSGPTTAGQFHAIDPSRVYDSRVPQPSPGALASGTSRTITVRNSRTTDAGAIVNPDLVPAGATAISFNLTIADTVGSGYLAVNAGGDNSIRASSINWSTSGQVLANGLVVKLDASRQITVVCGGGGSTNFVVDVLGYYR